MTGIEWTDRTWNPVTGCIKVSPGCKHCYAERMAERLRKMGGAGYAQGFAPKLQHHRLGEPLRWKKPQRIFVCSMSDLFQADVPDAYIAAVLRTIKACPQHDFQILTKRPERLPQLGIHWPANVWLGTSVENEAHAYRAEYLHMTKARIRWVSAEPLIGPIGPALRIHKLDWIVVGGESGPGARPMETRWAADLRDRALAAGVPFFFKQSGGRSGKGSKLLHRKRYEQFPLPHPGHEDRTIKMPEPPRHEQAALDLYGARR